MDLSNFHILCVISNPCRYESRYRLYQLFADEIVRLGATLWTVEMQTGARHAKVTEKENIKHLTLWGSAIPGEVWNKENLLNLGMQYIVQNHPEARYFAWIDADVKFEPGFLSETAHALQHWDVVQMWSHAVDFGPQGETIGQPHRSFMYCYWNQIDVTDKEGYMVGGHPGFAWAARRDSLNKLGTSISSGPLVDWGILGSADRHMAAALVGKVEMSFNRGVHPNYAKWLNLWQQNAEKNIRRNVGYVPGTLRHMWHGRKVDRQYASRWQILVKHQFDPETDLKRDVSGLWQLVSDTPRQMNLRDDCRRYFRARKEDATTVD